MKTNYRPRSNEPSRRQALTILTILILVGLGATLLRTPLMLLAEPIWRGRDTVMLGLNDLTAVFSSKVELERENESLRARLASYGEQVLACQVLESSRNELLRVYGQDDALVGVAASVLVRPPVTPYDLLILDAGSTSGVTVGHQVYLPEGGVIGAISEVGLGTSKATLYTMSGVKVEAVLERGGVPLTITGRGSGNFEATLPREVSVIVGDRILTPPLRTELIGVVGEISVTPTDSSQEVLINGLVNMQTLRFVFIKP